MSIGQISKDIIIIILYVIGFLFLIAGALSNAEFAVGIVFILLAFAIQKNYI